MCDILVQKKETSLSWRSLTFPKKRWKSRNCWCEQLKRVRLESQLTQPSSVLMEELVFLPWFCSLKMFLSWKSLFRFHSTAPNTYYTLLRIPNCGAIFASGDPLACVLRCISMWTCIFRSATAKSRHGLLQPPHCTYWKTEDITYACNVAIVFHLHINLCRCRRRVCCVSVSCASE